MPGWSRIGDITIGIANHGLPCCPHQIYGIRIQGSPTDNVNSKPASRAMRDLSIHDCPHCGVGICLTGSSSVFCNGSPHHRLNDVIDEFCGIGHTITASSDTFTGG